MHEAVIAHIDKTVVRIKGIRVKGLKPIELENSLKEIVKRPVRVIGVTGESIEMDIYGLEPEAIMASEDGIIKTISIVEGITATEVVQINSAEKIVDVNVAQIPKGNYSGCAKERWIHLDK